jgi:hypothetical protein
MCFTPAALLADALHCPRLLVLPSAQLVRGRGRVANNYKLCRSGSGMARPGAEHAQQKAAHRRSPRQDTQSESKHGSCPSIPQMERKYVTRPDTNRSWRPLLVNRGPCLAATSPESGAAARDGNEQEQVIGRRAASGRAQALPQHTGKWAAPALHSLASRAAGKGRALGRLWLVGDARHASLQQPQQRKGVEGWVFCPSVNAGTCRWAL